MKLLLLASLTVLTAAPAQEWTRFRGENGGGTSRSGGFSDNITEQNTAWKITLPGPGVSSPVLWGDRLFLTSEAAEPGQRLILAFDAASGKELWRVADTFSVHGKHQFNSFASSTPCVDADRLFLAWTNGGTMKAMALSHEGKPLWTRDLGA